MRWMIGLLASVVLWSAPALAFEPSFDVDAFLVQSQRGFYPQWPPAIGKVKPGGGIIVVSNQASSVASGPTPPSTCTPGDVWFDTDATTLGRFLVCDSPNVFVTLPALDTYPPPDDAVYIGDGNVLRAKIIPDCDLTTQKLGYDNASNAFVCNTDQTSATPPSYDQIQSGVNTAGTLTCGTGCTVTFSGSGTVNASTYKGNPTVAAADGGTGQTAVTDDGILVANGSIFQLKIVPDCSNASTSKVLYTAATNSWSCGTDQGAGAGVTFDAVGNGTNTTSGNMICGTGCSLVTSGTGILAASLSRPNSVTVTSGTSPLAAAITNQHIFCDTSGGNVVINLPAATVTARLFVYKTASANTCTINRAGADTINTGNTSVTSFVINNAGSNFWLQPDGASVWWVGG